MCTVKKGNCPCNPEDVEPIFSGNKNYCVSGIGADRLENILEGTRCKKCMKFTSREKGSRKEICRGCGTKMEDIGTQTIALTKKKVHMYECPLCGLIEY